jgi:hypothetical protein
MRYAPAPAQAPFRVYRVRYEQSSGEYLATCAYQAIAMHIRELGYRTVQELATDRGEPPLVALRRFAVDTGRAVDMVEP